MHTRSCTAGLRPKQTCSNIFASAHLQPTKWCLRSNAQGSSADSAASLAVSKCSLIQNTCRSYDEPRSTSQNLCAEVLAEVGPYLCFCQIVFTRPRPIATSSGRKE